MNAKRALLSLLVFAAAATAATRASAQEEPDHFTASQRIGHRSNPPGVTFTVSFRGGQTRFRPGEPIGLELAFSSSLPGAYHLDTAGDDRGGRPHADDFRLAPDDGAQDPPEDPPEDYSGSRLSGSVGGGLPGVVELEAKPYRIELDLNERLRPTRPGRYRLYVLSRRVGPGRRPAADGDAYHVVSNLVEFEVLPRGPARSASRGAARPRPTRSSGSRGRP